MPLDLDFGECKSVPVPQRDEYGGIALDEPSDEFGGVLVSEEESTPPERESFVPAPIPHSIGATGTWEDESGIPPEIGLEQGRQLQLASELAAARAEGEPLQRAARFFEPNLPRNALAPTTEEFLKGGDAFRSSIPPELQSWEKSPFRPPSTVEQLDPRTRENLAAGQALSGTLSDLSSADQVLVLGAAAATGGVPGTAGRILGAAVPATFGVEGVKSIVEGAKTLLSDEATPEERGQAKAQIGIGTTMLPGFGALLKRPAPIPTRIIEAIQKGADARLNKSAAAVAKIAAREEPIATEVSESAPSDTLPTESITQSTKGVTDASRIEETAAVHGDFSRGSAITPDTVVRNEPIEAGVSSGTSGRGGVNRNIEQDARALSKALREGNTGDLQYQLESSGMGPEELSRLTLLVSEEGAAPLEAIRQSAFRGRSISEAVKAAVAVSDYQKATGKIGNQISKDEITRITRETQGMLDASAQVSGKLNEPTTRTQPGGDITNASNKPKTTTLYESLRPSAIEGQGPLPIEESGGGVLPREESSVPREPARAQGGEEGEILLREKQIEAEINDLNSKRGRWDAADPRIEALKAEMRDLHIKREAASKTNPPGSENWEVSVQAEDPAYPGSGFMQIVDTSAPSENVKSPFAETLRAQGVDVPEFHKILPTGKYSYRDAIEKAKAAAQPAPVEPARVGAVPKNKAAAVRAADGTIYTGRWHPEAYEQLMRDKGVSKDEIIKQLKDGELEDGFLTSEGKFVRREEGAIIASAAKQFKPGKEGDIAFAGGLKGMEAGPGKIAPTKTSVDRAREAGAGRPAVGAAEGGATVAEPSGGAISDVGLSPARAGFKPGTSDIAQLTEFLKQPVSPKQTLRERIKGALDMAGDWAKGKDVVIGTLARVRAVSSAALDQYLHLPKFESFEKALGKWDGADQQTSLEVRNFQKAINKAVPNKLRQEAITNWIQADGDPALLRARAAASKPDVRPGYEAALTLNKAEQVLAENVREYLDSRLQEGIDTGLLKQGVNDYVNQIWKRDNPATTKMRADMFGDGTLNPSFKFAKKRIFDSYFDGEQAGFKPENKSIGYLLSAYDLGFNRALSARGFIKELHEGKAADGKPLTMVSGKTSAVPKGAEVPEAFLIKPHSAPDGAVTADGRPYLPIDHWALRDWKWQTKGPEGQPVFVQGDMLVHPDIYGHLKNVLSKSALTSREGVASYTTRPLLQASAFAKQSKLSLSVFHLDQEGLHGIFHRVNPANLAELDLNLPEQKSLVEHGLTVADPRGQELFAEGLSGGGIVGKIPGVGKLQVLFNDWLFRDYIPRLKMTMALDALERNRKAYAKDIDSGKITDDQLQALTARESNAAFGEQNYRVMGRNPTVQDLFRLAVLAPDFLEARSRFVGQALKPYGREQQAALALMGVTLYVTGRVLNQALDDNPHWDKPFSVIHKGREYKLRTVLGDLQHLWTDPRAFIYNRLSPIGRSAVEGVTSRDDRGIKRSSLEQFKDLASWFKPIPLQVRSDTTAGQAVLGSAGIGSRKYGAVQQLYELADDWKKNNKDPKIIEQYERERKETLPDSIYKPLRDALQKGDTEAAKEALLELRKTRPDSQIVETMTGHRPFTGTLHGETMFKRSLTPDQRKIYEAAVTERRRLADEFRKLRRANPKAPRLAP